MISGVKFFFICSSFNKTRKWLTFADAVGYSFTTSLADVLLLTAASFLLKLSSESFLISTIGTFKNGEYLNCNFVDSSGENFNVRLLTLAQLKNITIDNPGASYNVGDIVIIDGPSTKKASAVISEVESGVIEDVEIVTINVETDDVFLANGIVSHNKGTTTQPYIPSSGLRLYLDPSKSSSYQGADTSDWLDLSGYGTGFRPAGVANAAGVSGKSNPAYNNGATRKDKYFQGASNAFWYKDATTNINGG